MKKPMPKWKEEAIRNTELKIYELNQKARRRDLCHMDTLELGIYNLLNYELVITSYDHKTLADAVQSIKDNLEDNLEPIFNDILNQEQE